MKRFWGPGVVLLALLGLLCLSGCGIRAGDSLYSLPEAPQEYYDLQQALRQVLSTGAEYAAPVSGSNRQSTQSVDLDGDGEREVAAFFKSADNASLEVYIFDKQGESYTAAAVIEGSGSAIDSVEYVQLDGEPGLEIVVGWQFAESSLQYLGVYSLRDWHVTEMMSASYSRYRTVDLDGNGISEVFLIKMDEELQTGVTQLYVSDGMQMEKMSDANLSSGLEGLRRVVTGQLADGTPAVFVAGDYGGESIVTDVFTYTDGTFRNIFSQDGAGVTSQTVRNYYVYATDVNGDGKMELPQTRTLPVWPEESQETFCLIDWYSVQPDGTMQRQQTTFHNYAAGWYLTIPEAYCQTMTVYRQSTRPGQWTYFFAQWDDAEQTAQPVFAIWAFNSGEQPQSALTPLGEVAGVSYAVELIARDVSARELQDAFGPIHTDWNTGET